ncbi:putative structural protein [Escherichia phage vB_EcoM_ESCO50]|uniref:Structural protein n=1 Tax=Escherichia phage vB_EcoM_ESCO50 TaxID=2918872 RepID=A0AAE9KUW3_9CAUD|nr:putative structural protein [Escherichia phage vB_EcoM_ESCO50]
MAYQGFTKLGNREPLNDIILWEQITPTGHSRKEYTPVASTDYRVGEVLKADGTKVAAGQEAQADSVCIVNFYADLQLSYHGQLKVVGIYRDAELKDTLTLGTGVNAATVKAALAAKGITFVPTGL